MNYIIYDLEFNQKSTEILYPEADNSSLPFEIIQIGAVKLNENFQRVSEFNTLIKPTVHTVIHPFIENLTGINNDMVSFHKNFPQIYEDFIRFIGDDEIVLCVWGTVDIKELFRNMKFHKLPALANFKFYIDVQHYASKYFKFPKAFRIGLKNAVDLLGIPSKNEFHDAYNDAYYTSEVFKIIYDDTVVPKVYTPASTHKRVSRPKEIVDEKALIKQFEKMYNREMSEDERSIIKLAYFMGKTRQFCHRSNADSLENVKGQEN
ncbi:MAG: exonuclease domain-containing protein [Bacillota bacterium]|nr:exonuclease domain-containing protein [Bacillota bacterium]